MEKVEVKILLRNLLKRIKTQDDGSHQLPGVLTDEEIEALRLAVELFGSQGGHHDPVHAPIQAPYADRPQVAQVPDQAGLKSRIELDLSSLTSPAPPKNARLCLDFGTAMSKATLVKDGDDDDEEIHVLQLGVPGDQEDISPVMLISSIFIDSEGKLWFGKAAVDRSMLEGSDGSRQRMDNIKRRLSEDGWDEEVGSRFNPIKDLRVTYGDMVLAYLMFMTWAVNNRLEEMGYPWNLTRRFAMPCLTGEKRRETVRRLGRCVGEAQVLADTFYKSMKDGLPLGDFIAAVEELRRGPRKFDFVAEDITEPLGVAGAIMSWKKPVDMLMLVVDIGAGTSDLSLYRIHINMTEGNNTAIEFPDSAMVLTEAGNHLDQILIELIVSKSGITSADPMWVNVRGALQLEIRNYKESLFNDGYLFVNLLSGAEVEINLEEFLRIESVRKFGENLRKAATDILESVDQSWIKWILANPKRRLVVALTGGGAELPMVKELAEGSLRVGEFNVPVARALRFPPWLSEIDSNLEDDFSRIAVSLGGARHRLIERGPEVHITAGDGTQAPILEGYYTKGH